MIRRPPRSTLDRSSAASDVYKRQGIRSYDLQYRLGANSVWTNLLSNGPVPWAEFIFVSPQTVFFRGRARDNAFNVQEWTTNPNGDTHTTAYQWEVTGNVLDTRSIPIANPVLNLTPPALGVDVGNNPGAYTAYISTTQVYTTWATQSGYQPAAPTPRLISHDTQLDFYLAPADNLIRNGDFELDAPALRDWIVRGAVSAQAQRDACRTGRWGAGGATSGGGVGRGGRVAGGKKLPSTE